MTRTVDDAALMMCVLSKPDRRDGTSLPADNSLHWKVIDKPPRKLRLLAIMFDVRGTFAVVSRGSGTATSPVLGSMVQKG